MFIFCVLLTLITYPIVFCFSLVLLLLATITFSLDSNFNPFVSPNTLYMFYRQSFEKSCTALKNWYVREKNR